MAPHDLPAENLFSSLLSVVERLRGPEGCPWDRAQTRDDIGRYLLEECYEVLGALERGTPADLQEELGDLLFLILMMARMAAEEGQFDIDAVLKGVQAKMIRRHPHVFGSVRVEDADDVRRNWEWIKTEVEHKVRRTATLTEGIGRSLPTLARAQQITARASTLGFDWPKMEGVLAKVEEELGEFRAAMAAGDRRLMDEEAGDLLFTLVNLCRFAGTDAERSLRGALDKFLSRFQEMEKNLAAGGRSPQGMDPAEWEALWSEAKQKKGTA